MKLMFLGDIVGKAGRDVVVAEVPRLREQLGLDFVVANGENAAHGFGISPKICEDLFDAGVDVITGGNHSWDRPEILSYIDEEPRLLRPANFPAGTPGKGVSLFDSRDGKHRVLVINVMSWNCWTIPSMRWKKPCPKATRRPQVLIASWSICMARQRQRNMALAISVMDAPALLWAPIPMSPQEMHIFWNMAPAIRPMRACAAIMTA
jgi:hypothetical protein